MNRIELYLEGTELAALDWALLAASIRGVSADIETDSRSELCLRTGSWVRVGEGISDCVTARADSDGLLSVCTTCACEAV